MKSLRTTAKQSSNKFDLPYNWSIPLTVFAQEKWKCISRWRLAHECLNVHSSLIWNSQKTGNNLNVHQQVNVSHCGLSTRRNSAQQWRGMSCWRTQNLDESQNNHTEQIDKTKVPYDSTYITSYKMQASDSKHQLLPGDEHRSKELRRSMKKLLRVATLSLS